MMIVAEEVVVDGLAILKNMQKLHAEAGEAVPVHQEMMIMMMKMMIVAEEEITADGLVILKDIQKQREAEVATIVEEPVHQEMKISMRKKMIGVEGKAVHPEKMMKMMEEDGDVDGLVIPKDIQKHRKKDGKTEGVEEAEAV